jgi:hypothetical protein
MNWSVAIAFQPRRVRLGTPLLWESPLTFRAIIIWRDELNDGKVSLRDIIDLEATDAGPDAKNVAALAPADGPGNGAAAGQPCRSVRASGARCLASDP